MRETIDGRGKSKSNYTKLLHITVRAPKVSRITLVGYIRVRPGLSFKLLIYFGDLKDRPSVLRAFPKQTSCMLQKLGE